MHILSLLTYVLTRPEINQTVTLITNTLSNKDLAKTMTLYEGNSLHSINTILKNCLKVNNEVRDLIKTCHTTLQDVAMPHNDKITRLIQLAEFYKLFFDENLVQISECINQLKQQGTVPRLKNAIKNIEKSRLHFVNNYQALFQPLKGAANGFYTMRNDNDKKMFIEGIDTTIVAAINVQREDLEELFAEINEKIHKEVERIAANEHGEFMEEEEGDIAAGTARRRVDKAEPVVDINVQNPELLDIDPLYQENKELLSKVIDEKIKNHKCNCGKKAKYFLKSTANCLGVFCMGCGCLALLPVGVLAAAVYGAYKGMQMFFFCLIYGLVSGLSGGGGSSR